VPLAAWAEATDSIEPRMTAVAGTARGGTDRRHEEPAEHLQPVKTPLEPDLSPIEEAFSKIKALVKAAAARTRGALDAAIAAALDAVTAADIAGWFTHAGYLNRQAS
jgi:hypothetical protein